MSNPTEPLHFRPLAAFLGWVFPGLGHIASGNVRRGVFAMTGVLFLFVGGVAVGGVDCVDRVEDKLWFVGQACCGPIAFGVDAVNTSMLKSGSAAPLIPLPPSVLDPNEFGTFFVFLAGLMNFCVILDALVRAPKSDAVFTGRRSQDGAVMTASVGGGA